VAGLVLSFAACGTTANKYRTGDGDFLELEVAKKITLNAFTVVPNS